MGNCIAYRATGALKPDIRFPKIGGLRIQSMF